MPKLLSWSGLADGGLLFSSEVDGTHNVDGGVVYAVVDAGEGEVEACRVLRCMAGGCKADTVADQNTCSSGADVVYWIAACVCQSYLCLFCCLLCQLTNYYHVSRHGRTPDRFRLVEEIETDEIVCVDVGYDDGVVACKV